MREAEAQVEVRPLDGGPESDAFDLELLGESFAHSPNHVVLKTARKSVQRFHAARFGFTHDRYTVVCHARLDVARKRPLHFSFRPFHRHLAAISDVHLDLVRNLDRSISNS